MTDGMMQFMGYDPYKMHLTAPMGEAVSKWLKHRYPDNTAKTVAREADLDTRTADNILAGHLSGVTITKLMRAYGWGFMAAVGAAVIGETYEKSITREIEEIANERRQLDALETHLRDRYARLRARGALDPGGLRLVHPEDTDTSREDRRLG